MSREAIVLIAELVGAVVFVGGGLFALACWAESDAAKQKARSFARDPSIGRDQSVGERLERLRQIQANNPAVRRLAARREEERRASARLTQGF